MTEGAEATLVGCSGACPRNLIIPDRVDGIRVTAIGDSAFEGVVLDDVAFTNNLISIGSYAFRRTELKFVSFPSALESIGYQAFSENRLRSVTLGESVKDIRAEAFSYQLERALKHLDLGRVRTVARYAFAGNELTRLVLPDSLTNLNEYAFADNTLTSVTLLGDRPDLTSAFLDNPSLEEITYCGTAFGWPGDAVPIGESASVIAIEDCDETNLSDLDGDGFVDVIDDFDNSSTYKSKSCFNI